MCMTSIILFYNQKEFMPRESNFLSNYLDFLEVVFPKPFNISTCFKYPTFLYPVPTIFIVGFQKLNLITVANSCSSLWMITTVHMQKRLQLMHSSSSYGMRDCRRLFALSQLSYKSYSAYTTLNKIIYSSFSSYPLFHILLLGSDHSNCSIVVIAFSTFAENTLELMSY